MHDLALGNPGADAVPHRAFEDAPEPIGAHLCRMRVSEE